MLSKLIKAFMVQPGVLFGTCQLATSKPIFFEVLRPGWRTRLAAFTLQGNAINAVNFIGEESLGKL